MASAKTPEEKFEQYATDVCKSAKELEDWVKSNNSNKIFKWEAFERKDHLEMQLFCIPKIDRKRYLWKQEFFIFTTADIQEFKDYLQALRKFFCAGLQ